MRITEALAVIDALAPAELNAKLSPETHEQAMACLSCGLAGMTPPSHFPQAPGLWERPCPKCGEETVWIAEPRVKTTDKIK